MVSLITFPWSSLINIIEMRDFSSFDQKQRKLQPNYKKQYYDIILLCTSVNSRLHYFECINAHV